LPKMSHSKNSARYYHRCIHSFMQSTQYSCQILIKIDCSLQIFEKYSYTKLHANPSSGSGVVACGQTDRKTDMTQLVVTLKHFANAPKIDGRLCG
jgi:hypothetical protein